MSVKGKRVVHCSGADKAKTIKGGTHKTHAGAVAQHRAIQASKRGRAKA